MYRYNDMIIIKDFVFKEKLEGLLCNMKCHDCAAYYFVGVTDSTKPVGATPCSFCGSNTTNITTYHLTTNVDNFNLKGSLVETLDDLHNVLVKAMNMSLLYWCKEFEDVNEDAYSILLNFLLEGVITSNLNRSSVTANKLNNQIAHYIERFFDKEYSTNFMFNTTLLKKDYYMNSLEKLYKKDIVIGYKYVIVFFSGYSLVLSKSMFSNVFFESLSNDKYSKVLKTEHKSNIGSNNIFSSFYNNSCCACGFVLKGKENKCPMCKTEITYT